MEKEEVRRIKTSELEDHVQCCLDSHTLQDPYLLMCCHIYCKSCLPQLQVEDGYICQVCQLTTPTERLLPSDFMWHMVKKCQESKQDPECSHCSSTSAPSYQCVECQVFVCSDACQVKHLRLSASHQIIPFNKESDVIIKPLLCCSEHVLMRLEMYCEECDEIVCKRCWSTKHASHKIKLHTLDYGIDSKLEQVKEYRIELKDMEATIKSTKSSAEEKMDTFNDSIDEKLKELQVYKDRLIAQIELEYLELKKKISVAQLEINKYYEQVINEEKNKLTCVRRALEWSRLVEVHAESECFLKTLQTELIPQLKALCESLNEEQSPIVIRKPEEVVLHLLINNQRQMEFSLPDVFSIEEFSHLIVTKEIDNFMTNNWMKIDMEQLIQNNSVNLLDCEWQYDITEGNCFSLLALDDRILVPLDSKNIVIVLSHSGEHLLTKTYPETIRCRGIQRLTNNTLLLATTKGLYILDSSSLDIKEHIYTRGQVVSPFLAKDEIVALSCQKDCLLVLVYIGNRKLSEKHIELHGYQNVNINDTVVKNSGVIYLAVYNSNTLFSYNEAGELLAQYGGVGATQQLDIAYPRLQGVDSQGNIVWVEQKRKCLKILKQSGEVENLNLQHENSLTHVLFYNEHMLVAAKQTVGSYPLVISDV